MVFTIYGRGDHTDHVTGRFDIFSFAAVMYKTLFVINIIIHMFCEFGIVVFLFLREGVCSP